MRVLQINSVCGTGSTGRIAADIHNILSGRGHESFIAYGRGTPLNCGSAIRIGTGWDNYSHVALTRLFDRHGFGSRRATRDFVEKVRAFDPDIIHLHNLHGYYINIETLFAYLKNTNKPVIWTLHDCWAFTGHCAYFDYAGCGKWRTGCFDCPLKKTYPESSYKDNSRENYRIKKDIFSGLNNLTIVTPSNWLADLVSESFLGEYPVKVINNGIDLDKFKPVQSEFRNKYDLKNKFVILGVASVWSERKGLKYFVELSENLGRDMAMVLVGLNKNEIAQLPENIIGLGKTDSVNELAEIYTAADIFVNPTLEDNFPTVNLEALACGTPVVTFDTGGSPECLDETCGIVVEKGSLPELRNAVCKVKDGGFKRENCVNKAKAFDKNVKFQEYIDLYNKVLGCND